MFIKTIDGNIHAVAKRIDLNRTFICKESNEIISYKDVCASAPEMRLLEGAVGRDMFADDGKITEEIQSILSGQLIQVPVHIDYDTGGFRDVRNGSPLGSFTGKYDRNGDPIHVRHILINPNNLDIGTLSVDVIIDNDAVKFMGASINDQLFEIDSNFMVIGTLDESSDVNQYYLHVITEVE